MEEEKERERLKRRLRAYVNLGNNYVYTFESDFKAIFNKIKQKRNIKGTFFRVIELCKDKDITEMNQKLDCYQIDKKYGF